MGILLAVFMSWSGFAAGTVISKIVCRFSYLLVAALLLSFGNETMRMSYGAEKFPWCLCDCRKGVKSRRMSDQPHL